MSSIAFPHPLRDAAAADDASRISFFPAAFDPQASTSSFQINPLSSHPPRTPRTSLAPAPAFPTDPYGTADARPPAPAYDDDDGDDKLAARAAPRVRREDVWREVLASSTGRDKALKLIQYAMRVYLLAHRGVRRGRAASAPERGLFARLDAAMAGLSLARKCLILFNWVAPLAAITAPPPLPYARAPPPPFLHKFLHAPPPVLLDLLGALADDAATLARLGLVGRRAGARAERLANWCWFGGTLVALVEVGVEQGLVRNLMDEAESRLYAASCMEGAPPGGGSAADEKELERLRRQHYWLRISRAKLLMDLVFVSYECFHFARARAPAMGLSGLLSAALSTMKLYDRHRAALITSLAH